MAEMYMDFPSINTPQVSCVATFDPYRNKRHASIDQSIFATAGNKINDLFSILQEPLNGVRSKTSLDLFSDSEQTQIPDELIAAKAIAPTQESSPSNEIEKISNHRIRLMAIKYAKNKESSEAIARLEILNERLLEISPRVSPDQIKTLEDIGEKLANLREEREKQSQRLGISY